jgi:hypothetical protein
MRNTKEHLSKLTATLSRFSPEEWKLFQRFVTSPFFKISAPAQNLFLYYDKHFHSLPSLKLNAETIAKKQSSLSTKEIQAKAGSELLQAAVRFWIHTSIAEKQFDSQLLLLEKLHQKQMFDAFQKLHQKLTEDEQKKGIQDFFALERQYKLLLLWFNSYPAKLNRTSENDITALALLREQNFALQQLNTYCDMQDRHRLLGTKEETPHRQWIINTLAPFNSPEHLYVFIFTRILALNQTNSETALTAYQEIKKCYTLHPNNQPLPDALTEAIGYLAPFTTHWFNKGKMEMGEEYLWWIDQKEKHHLLINSGYIEIATYRNYIITCITLFQPKERLSKFINTYSKFIPPNMPVTHQNFCNALYYYYVGELDRSLLFFEEALVAEEPIFNAIVRRWEFEALYEKHHREMPLILINKLESFEKYILRGKKEIHQYKARFNLFISCAKKLLQANDKKTKQVLKSFIEEQEFFPGKMWLLRKL